MPANAFGAFYSSICAFYWKYFFIYLRHLNWIYLKCEHSLFDIASKVFAVIPQHWGSYDGRRDGGIALIYKTHLTCIKIKAATTPKVYNSVIELINTLRPFHILTTLRPFHILATHRPFHILTTLRPFHILATHRPFHILATHRPFHILATHRPFHILATHRPFHILATHRPFHILATHRPFHILATHKPFHILATHKPLSCSMSAFIEDLQTDWWSNRRTQQYNNMWWFQCLRLSKPIRTIHWCPKELEEDSVTQHISTSTHEKVPILGLLQPPLSMVFHKNQSMDHYFS